MLNILFDSNDKMYEYFRDKNICRLCWNKEGVQDLTVSSECKQKQTLVANLFREKIKDCLNLEFENGSYPSKTCNKCVHKITEFYEYKYFCQENEKRLQDMFKNIPAVKFSEMDRVKIESDNKQYDSFDFPIEFNGKNSRTYLNNKSMNDDIKMNESKCLNSVNVNDDCTDNGSDYFSESGGINDKILAETVTEGKTKNILEQNLNKDLQTFCQKSTQKVFKKKYKQKRSASYCNICRSDLGSIEMLASHNSSNHGIEGNLFKCFGCIKSFKTRKARLAHEINFCKGLKDGYKCGICERFLPRRSMYETHKRDHKENPDVKLPENIFQCVKCSKLFKTKLCLKEHMEEHDSFKKNYVCETCGRVFTRQDYLHKHRLTHTGTKQHVCPHCGYRTAQKSSLTVHLRKHTGERPYICDLCPQRCISSSNLRAHRQRHLGDKTFECTICKKKFGYKISLEEHIASVHERSQGFPCEMCGALYTRARGLRRHMLAKHAKQKVDKDEQRDGSTSEVSNLPKDVADRKCDNVYLKIIDNVSEQNKVTISENAVYEIKNGDEFVLLNAESGVLLTKMY